MYLNFETQETIRPAILHYHSVFQKRNNRLNLQCYYMYKCICTCNNRMTLTIRYKSRTLRSSKNSQNVRKVRYCRIFTQILRNKN